MTHASPGPGVPAAAGHGFLGVLPTRLGACKPPLAQRALSAEPGIVLLP